MAALKLSFLGSPKVEHDDVLVEIGASKALALLVYLAVTEQNQSRDALSTLLWPDSDQSRARTYLRHALWSLKKALGEQWLYTSREQIGFRADDDVWLDVQAFEAGITAVANHDHSVSQMCPDCLAQLHEAISLYRDNFLAGFTLPDSPAFDEWQFFQAEERRQMLAGALERLVQEYTARQEFDSALAYARRWLILDPLHEPVHRILMRLYALSGQQAAALRQYEECVRLLDEELGIEPETETTALHESIRTRQFDMADAVETAEPAAPPPAADRYLIADLLDTGAHGEVYRGQDTQTGEPVIIKRLRPDAVRKDKRLVDRFLQEAEALSQLNHPNIVRLLATFERDGQQYLVMEYVAGGSLAQRLQRQPKMTLTEALDIALELADALSRAHHVNIIHRDVKPENVLMAADGTPRLTDFGVARLMKKDGRLTETGALLGSPAYMSPELLQGKKPDVRSDIWSFGVLLFEMLAGQRPFPGEQITAVMISILNDATPDVRQFRSDVPEALADLLRRMLAKDVADRIGSMRLVAARLEAVRNDILSGKVATASAGIISKHSLAPEQLPQLPTQSVAFVGREPEQRDLQRSLQNPVCRLLTITGPGGIGKTRLALALAETSQHRFPDGVQFVSLTALQSAKDMVMALGNSLGLQFDKEGELLEQALRYLRRKHLLLILDNFEHLLAEATSIVSAMLEAAPLLKIVVTSRERLALSSEVVYPLAGLRFPDQERVDETDVRRYSAVQLLLQRAAAVRPGLAPDAQSMIHVVRICQMVGGMPLALVLAASWLDILSFEEVADEIARGLDFLATEMSDIPARQRSMRTVFATSWQSLSAEEQQTVMGLTVFHGGFVREAAQAVTQSGPRILQKLVNKSLLVVDGNGRFDMHELLRQYIQEQLLASPATVQQARSQHASYYASFLGNLAGLLKGAQQQEALALLEAELENVRTAWHWLVQQGQWEALVYQILPALFRYCELRFKAVLLWSLLSEAQQGLLVSEENATNHLLFILLTAKSAFFYTGVTNRLKVDNETRIGDRETVIEAWQLRKDAADQRDLPWQILLAFFYGQLVSPEEGTAVLLKLLPDLQQENQAWELGLAMQNLGQLYLPSEEDQAEFYLTRALDIFQRIGDGYESSITLYLMGLLLMRRQQLTEARTYFLLAQQGFSREEDFAIFALINWKLADLSICLGKPEEALEHLQQSYQLFLARGAWRSALSFLSRESFESLRYGTIERALETREECLKAVAEADDPLGEPWYTWEMGEIYRVRGDLEQARKWYERAFAAFKKTQDHYDATFFNQGMAFYHRGLGNIALAQNKYEKALEHLQESLNMAEASGHKWIMTYALADLGRTSLLIGQHDMAQRQLVQALKLAKQISNGGIAMVALANVVLLHTIKERWNEANKLGVIVFNHPLTWQETKNQIAALLAEKLSLSDDQNANGRDAQWTWLDIVDRQIIPLQSESSDTTELSSISASGSAFVARERELGWLGEMFNRVLNGRAQVAFILGEAGQGKTALLQAFANRARQLSPEVIVAGGSCNAYTGLGDPYLPFREILGVLTADLEASSLIGTTQPGNVRHIKRLLPETVRVLVEMAPDLIDTLIPLAGLLERTSAAHLAQEGWRSRLLKRANQSPNLDPNLQQGALLDQYARLLQALAQRAPLLLLLDDLQWADPGSVALLFHLGRRLAHYPLFIVGAYRPDEVARGQDGEPHPFARIVNELQRLFGDILIDLGQAQGQAFIDAWLDSEPNRLGKFFRQTLYRQTGGHPLFTIELLRAMRERGDLEQDKNGVWQVQTSINWNRLPARVEGAIGERIKRLDSSLQEMLQVASVEGEEFTAEVIAQILQRDERETVRLLSGELDKVHALVRAIGARRAGERRFSRYRFRHILIQRYLYSLLDDVERIYQHEAIGNALETLHTEQVTEVAVQLARHFEIAQLPEKAIIYLRMAGDQARRAAALTEAIRHYQAALSRWPDDDTVGRANLLRKLGECQWMTGHADDALATFETGYDLFQALDDVEEAGAMQRLIGRVYWERGNREKSLHHYHRALTILEPLSDSVELAWAISSISQMHMNADEYTQAIAWGNRALALARRLQAESVVVHALNNLGTSYINTGQVEKGREMLEESIHLALEGNLPHDAGRGRLNLGEALASRDYYDEARAKFEALYEQASRVHTTLYAGSALIELARLDWLNGRWRSALSRTSLIDKWLEVGQSVAYLRVISTTVFGRQYNDLGQPEAAYKILKSSVSEARDFDEIQLMSPHLTQMVRALAALGREAETKAVTRELLDTFADANYISRFTALPLLYVCDALPANVLAKLFDSIVETLQILKQDENNGQVSSRRAALYELQGMVALIQENLDQAVTAFRQAAETWQAVERPYDQARAFKKLGETLILAGEYADACDAFNQGNTLIKALAEQLDDEETKATFLQSPLVQSMRNGLLKSKT